MRGKLVEQDPNDEPASELLKRIADERHRRIKNKVVKKPKPVPEVDVNEVPRDLPEGWTMKRLTHLVTVLNGRAYKKQELLDSGKTPVLRVGNLFTNKHWYYSDLELEPDKYCSAGDLIYAWSASFGPFVWDGPKAIFHYHIWKLDFHSPADVWRDYLYQVLLHKTAEIKASGHGIAMVHMTKEKMEKLAIPIPPLAEQKRIVAKVDVLMALCDKLEASLTESSKLSEKLATAVVAGLNEQRS